MPGRALGEHGHLGHDVRAGLEVAERLALLAAALVAGADADDAAVVDEELLGGRLGQDHRAACLGLLGEEATELRERDDPVAVVHHRRRRRDAERPRLREQVDGLALDRAVVRDLLHRQPPREQLAQRTRVDDGAGEEVRAGLLALLEHGDRHLAEALCQLRMLLEQLSEPDRAREAAGAAPDDQHADLDPLVHRIGRRADDLGGGERRREVGRPDGVTALTARRARTSSVSFGAICCRSPTTPKSAKSKIGAFGSLLMATIVPELCIPTLCWIAPEMPSAM